MYTKCPQTGKQAVHKTKIPVFFITVGMLR